MASPSCSQYLLVVGKRGPVVSSHGEVTTPFTQNASWWLTGTQVSLRKDTTDSQDSWVCNPTSCCLGPSSWQQLSSTGPSGPNIPQCCGQLPVPSASQSGLPSSWRPSALPTAQKGHPDPTQCSQAPSPTYHPQPGGTHFAPWEFCCDGHSSPGLGKRIQIQRVWERGRCSSSCWLPEPYQLERSPPSFLPSPHLLPSTP